MVRRKKTPAQKWQGLFRDVLRQVDDVRDIGGMERIARMYSERDQEVLAGRLEELLEKSKGWANDLRRNG
jgi:hypothetical protein